MITPNDHLIIAQIYATLSAGCRVASRTGNITGTHSYEERKADNFEAKALEHLRTAEYRLEHAEG